MTSELLAVPSLLRRAVSARGAAPAVTAYDDQTGQRTELSWATLGNWVAKTGNLMAQELGLRRGDRIVVGLGATWPAMVTVLAAWHVGAAVVPADADDPDGGAELVLRRERVAAAFVREDVLGELGGSPAADRVVAVGTGVGARLRNPEAVGDALPWAEEVLAFGDDYEGVPAELDDVALLAARGVPTGDDASPPRAPLSQRRLVAAADAFADECVGADDRVLVALPGASLVLLALAPLAALRSGASLVLVRATDAASLPAKAQQERVTVALLSPAVLDVVREVGIGPLPGVRTVVSPDGVSSALAAQAEGVLGVPVVSGSATVSALDGEILDDARP